MNNVSNFGSQKSTTTTTLTNYAFPIQYTHEGSSISTSSSSTTSSTSSTSSTSDLTKKKEYIHSIDPRLFSINWYATEKEEPWIRDCFTNMYKPLNQFVESTSHLILPYTNIPNLTIYETVKQGSVYFAKLSIGPSNQKTDIITSFFKPSIISELKHQTTHHVIEIVIKIVSFHEHVKNTQWYTNENLQHYWSSQQYSSAQQNNIHYVLHPWQEIVALNYVGKEWFLGHINIDTALSPPLSTTSTTSTTSSTSSTSISSSTSASATSSKSLKKTDLLQESPWNTRYVVMFQKKFHSSLWSYCLHLKNWVKQSHMSNELQRQAYGNVLWSVFSQVTLLCLSSFKRNAYNILLCHNDLKIDNIMYNKIDASVDLYIQLIISSTISNTSNTFTNTSVNTTAPSILEKKSHTPIATPTFSSNSSSLSTLMNIQNPTKQTIMLRIPTFGRMFHLIDFGYSSIKFPNGTYACSIAPLLYTKQTMGNQVMNVTNPWSDFYQLMLSLMSFKFIFGKVKHPIWESFIQLLYGCLYQTNIFRKEDICKAASLEDEQCVHNFYINASKCTTNPLPYLLPSIIERYRYEGVIPPNSIVKQLHVHV